MPRLTCHGLFLAPWGSDLRLVLLPSSQLESSSLHGEAGTWASCSWRRGLDAAMKGEGPGLLSPLLTGTDCHTRRTRTGLTATAVTPAFLCRPSWGVGQRPGHASLAWGGGDPPSPPGLLSVEQVCSVKGVTLALALAPNSNSHLPN